MEEIKLNGLVMWKIRNSWQLVKHPWLYSDLLQDSKGETLIALGSQQRAAQYPTAREAGLVDCATSDWPGNDSNGWLYDS